MSKGTFAANAAAVLPAAIVLLYLPFSTAEEADRILNRQPGATSSQ